ncbi:MAG: trigger factor [Acidobacteria bacterium]|nr:trigger factor [Acidobacteriota bacterium]
MKSQLKEVSPTEREINLTIDAASLKDAYGKISQRFVKGANIPGFRKGYAPVDVVRLRYKEEIKQEVLQLLVPEKVSAAIVEHGLQPLSEPHLHIDDVENVKVNGSQDVELHVHVEVMPEIPEPKYKALELTRRVKPVDDSEIEDLIARRINEEAALVPVEGRASQEGDTVIADLEGTFADDPDAEPITAEDLEVKLGDELIEKSFTENLVGVKEDDEKEFTVSYPADFSSPALAGKTVHYKAKIKSVGIMETPELNDEWAVALDEGYESLADLRAKLRADLEKLAESDADARLRNNAIAKLIEQNEFEVPNTLIENQARNLLNNFAQDLQQRGVDLNKVETNFIEMAYSQMRLQAERDVRGAILLEKVGDAEGVTVETAEVDEEIGKMAEYYRTEAAEMRKMFETQGGLANIENNLRTRKAIEALVAAAKVTDGPWVDESQPESEAAETEEKPKKAAKAKAPAKPRKTTKKAAGEE